MSYQEQIQQFEEFWPVYVDYLMLCAKYKHPPKSFQWLKANHNDKDLIIAMAKVIKKILDAKKVKVG